MTTVIIPPPATNSTAAAVPLPPAAATALPLPPLPPPALTQMAQAAGLTPVQAWAALQQARAMQGLVQQQAAMQMQQQQQQNLHIQHHMQAQQVHLQAQQAHQQAQQVLHNHVQQQAIHQQILAQHQQHQALQMQALQHHIQASIMGHMAVNAHHSAAMHAQAQQAPLQILHALRPNPPPPPPSANPFLQPIPLTPSALWHQARAAREAGDAAGVERARREMFRGALEGVRRARCAAELAERRVMGAYFGLDGAATSPTAVASAAVGGGGASLEEVGELVDGEWKRRNVMD